MKHIKIFKSLTTVIVAKEAAMSRLMGGIHYRVDCDAGLAVGNNVGNYAVQRAQADGAN